MKSKHFTLQRFFEEQKDFRRYNNTLISFEEYVNTLDALELKTSVSRVKESYKIFDQTSDNRVDYLKIV